RRHTRFSRDWSSDVCSSDLLEVPVLDMRAQLHIPAIQDVDGAGTRELALPDHIHRPEPDPVPGHIDLPALPQAVDVLVFQGHKERIPEIGFHDDQVRGVRPIRDGSNHSGELAQAQRTTPGIVELSLPPGILNPVDSPVDGVEGTVIDTGGKPIQVLTTVAGTVA